MSDEVTREEWLDRLADTCDKSADVQGWIHLSDGRVFGSRQLFMAIKSMIEQAPCPHIATSREGTSYCRLAESGGASKSVQVDDAMVERAAYALELSSKHRYGWTDDQFDAWWNRDPIFCQKIDVWSSFNGTRKEKLLHEARIILEAALNQPEKSP